MSLDNEIASGVLSSIDLLIDQRLQEVKSDKTILVTIEEQDKDDTSKYLVSNGSMKFYAYANSDTTTTYTKNQKVYVLVPEGDYNLKRIIIGSYTNENLKYSYASANKLKDYVKVVNLVDNITVDTYNATDYTSTNLLYKAPYDYICITLTPNDIYKIPEDYSYNYLFELMGIDDNTLEEFSLLSSPIIISKQELRGNGNILNPYIKYEFLYSLDNIDITTLNYIAIQGFNSNNTGEYTIAFDISISLGYSKSNTQLNTNIIKIYTDQEQEYDQIDEDIDLNLEVFGAEDNLIGTGYSPTNNISELILYRYEVGTGSTDSIQGVNWKQVGYYNPTLTSSLSSYQTTDNIINNGGTIKLANLFFMGTATTKFKIRCILKGQKDAIWSEVLSYTNKNIDQTAEVKYGEGIKLTLSDSGIYNYYGVDGQLLNDSVFKANKYITVSKETETSGIGPSLMSNSESATYTEGVERIEWIYPTTLTGIEPVYQTTEDENGNKTSTTIPVGLINSAEKKWTDTFTFKVKDHCYDTYINNTITCKVYFKGEVAPRTATISLEFGGYKTRNTPYSLNIDFKRKDQRYISYNDILKSDSTSIELEATLERIDGETTDLSETTFTWSWLEPAAAASESSAVSNTMYFVNESGTLLDDGLTYSEETAGISSVFIKPPANPNIGYNAIVQVTAKNMQINDITNMDIVAYLPIAICLDATTTGENISYMYQGPTRVVYSGFNDCSYDKEVIKLYADSETIELSDVTIGTWQSASVYDLNESHDRPSPYKNHYIARGDNNKETPNCLVLSPRSAALINQKPQVNTIYIYSNDELIWMQPILTIRDKWENVAYDWKGTETSMTKEALYSPFIAAGTNEADSTFTGVMLGKLSRSGDTVWGLYGTQKGDTRFYMTENAEFYVGKPDDDPDNSYYIQLDKDGVLSIKVEDFDLTVENSYIKLNNDGELEVHLEKNFLLNVPHMIIDSEQQFIKIYDDNNNEDLKVLLGQVATNKYGLNIYDGAITIYDKQLNEVIYMNSQGEMVIKGNIQAETGKIGGFVIGTKTLSSSSSNITLSSTGVPINVQNGSFKVTQQGNVFIGNHLVFKWDNTSDDEGSNTDYRIWYTNKDFPGIDGEQLAIGKAYGYSNNAIQGMPAIVMTDAGSTTIYLNAHKILSPYGTIAEIANWVVNQNLGYRAVGTWGISSASSTAGHVHGLRFVQDGAYIQVSLVDNNQNQTYVGVSYNQSDIRLKHNIANTSINALSIIRNIQHISFDWNETNVHVTNSYAAQQLEQYIPEAVFIPSQEPDGFRQIKPEIILPYATKAIQELDEKITQLKNEIKELKQNEI